MPPTSIGPTVPRQRLGQELQALRKCAGVTGAQVAARMEWDTSKVSRLESGKVGITQKELRELLEVYGVEDPETRRLLLGLAKQGRERGWWAPYSKVIAAQYSTYVGLEFNARELNSYESMVVHGLLQTEEFARTIIRSSVPDASREKVETLVKLRLERQEALNRGTGPLQLSVVMDESVLHRHIGGHGVMRRQLAHLVAMSGKSHIGIRILPFTAGAYPGMVSAFTIIKSDDPVDPDRVYVEVLSGDVFPPATEVAGYARAFETLRALSLDAAASVELIEQMAARYDQD